MTHLGGLVAAETAARASLCCPLSPGPKTPCAEPCSPSMTEAGSMEVVAQAIISTPGLARDVLPTSYKPTFEVPYSEQRAGALAVTWEVVVLGLEQSQHSAAADE